MTDYRESIRQRDPLRVRRSTASAEKEKSSV